MQAYCVKEHKMVQMLHPKTVTMKNGRKATKGVDSKGHKLYRIGG